MKLSKEPKSHVYFPESSRLEQREADKPLDDPVELNCVGMTAAFKSKEQGMVKGPHDLSPKIKPQQGTSGKGE